MKELSVVNCCLKMNQYFTRLQFYELLRHFAVLKGSIYIVCALYVMVKMLGTKLSTENFLTSENNSLKTSKVSQNPTKHLKEVISLSKVYINLNLTFLMRANFKLMVHVPVSNIFCRLCLTSSCCCSL